MTEIRAVLFDFGHTLFDNATSVDFLVAESASLGAPLGRNEAGELFTEALARARTPAEMAKGRDLDAERHRACWLAIWSPLDALAPGLAERLYAHETSPAGWRLYPDALYVLDRLRASGIRLAVVSDTGWNIRAVFAYHGVAEHFETFVLSCELGVAKPAAEMFECACERLAITPEEVLMVGDNYRTDGGALEIGARVLLLPPTQAGAERGLQAVVSLIGC